MNDGVVRLDGVEEDVLDEDGQPVIDEKTGRNKTYMSPANLERMKLAHKIAHKIIDKVAPTVNKMEVDDARTMNPLLAEAMQRLLTEKRESKEKNAVDAEYSVEKQDAVSVRNAIRNAK